MTYEITFNVINQSNVIKPVIEELSEQLQKLGLRVNFDSLSKSEKENTFNLIFLPHLILHDRFNYRAFSYYFNTEHKSTAIIIYGNIPRFTYRVVNAQFSPLVIVVDINSLESIKDFYVYLVNWCGDLHEK